MKLTVETEREDNRRWIAEVPQLAGVFHMGKAANKRFLRSKFWRYAFLLNLWKAARNRLANVETLGWKKPFEAALF